MPSHADVSQTLKKFAESWDGFWCCPVWSQIEFGVNKGKKCEQQHSAEKKLFTMKEKSKREGVEKEKGDEYWESLKPDNFLSLLFYSDKSFFINFKVYIHSNPSSSDRSNYVWSQFVVMLWIMFQIRCSIVQSQK